MRNDSSDRGAKLVSGSDDWTNYVVEGDVQLLGGGSIGMLGRVSDAGLGENSFRGYLAGVRTADHSLFVGAYDFVYREAARVEMPEPVRPYRWYHIKLEVDGCHVTASAWAIGTEAVETRSVDDPDCFPAGRIGLRSNGTGGVWRNVRVSRLDAPDAGLASGSPLPELNTASFEQSLLPAGEALPEPVQSVESLRFLAPVGSPVASIRGSVTLTRPALYVQDSTGGVEVRLTGDTPLKIGDEVEVTGAVSLDEFSPVIHDARYRLIRQSAPEGPLDVTAQQIAYGSFLGQFVQIEGILRNLTIAPDGAVAMSLDSGAQTFSAVMPAGRSASRVKDIEVGSLLRVRGVSVVDARFSRNADPFGILVRSAEGVNVVSGPPFWRPTIFVFVGLVGLSLIFALNHFYLLVKHWRLHAVAEERERLANQIHDTLAQSFAGIGFQLQAIRNSIPPGDDALDRHVHMAMQMTQTSHEEARRCIASLRPEPLDRVSLVPALCEYAELIVKDVNVKVEASDEDPVRPVPARIKEALFRIGKEAIANSIRHANPRTIRIGLQRQRDTVCLSVEDDGQGFRADRVDAGFGMLGMRGRAESISATLAVRSTVGAGTRVEVQVAVGPRLRLLNWFSPGAWK
jgi:signal transduction histidine kinase